MVIPSVSTMATFASLGRGVNGIASIAAVAASRASPETVVPRFASSSILSGVIDARVSAVAPLPSHVGRSTSSLRRDAPKRKQAGHAGGPRNEGSGCHVLDQAVDHLLTCVALVSDGCARGRSADERAKATAVQLSRNKAKRQVHHRTRPFDCVAARSIGVARAGAFAYDETTIREQLAHGFDDVSRQCQDQFNHGSTSIVSEVNRTGRVDCSDSAACKQSVRRGDRISHQFCKQRQD